MYRFRAVNAFFYFSISGQTNFKATNFHQQAIGVTFWYFIIQSLYLQLSINLELQMSLKPNLELPDLQQYFIIKKSTSLPAIVNIFFTILEKAIQNPNQSTINKEHNQAFIQAFAKLNISQQALFLTSCIKFVVKWLFKKESDVIEKETEIRNIETSVQIYSSYLKFPIWTEYHFQLDIHKKTVIFTSKKRTDILKLSQYLVRKSKKFHNCIVLQGYGSENKSQNKKYVLFFKQSLTEQIYTQLFNAIIGIKKKQLQDMLKSSQKQFKLTKGACSQSNSMVFLSSKNINEFLAYKQGLIKYLSVAKLDFQQISNPNRTQYVIEQSHKNGKIFKLSADLQMQAKQAKKVLLSKFGSFKNKIILSSQVLEQFSHRFTALYQKYFFTNKIQQLLTIRQVNFSQQQDAIFIKGIQNLMFKNFLQYLYVKISNISGKSSKMVIFCSVILSQFITADKVKLYLFTFFEHCSNKSQKQLRPSLNIIAQQNSQMQEKAISKSVNIQHMHIEPKVKQEQQQFYTIYGDGIENQEYVQFIEGEQVVDLDEEKNKQREKKVEQRTLLNVTEHYQNFYKRYKYRFLPDEKFDKASSLLTQHYLFTDWNRKKEGGVVCKNQQIINNQKRLFKDLISRLGTNILKNGGILNISLPVIAFKKQSHLQSIARDFSYAPLILQNVSDNLQRMKYATLLALSVGALGISFQKPFNPLLGETLQGWIGGCPVYLEQISHHPPIGAYYFVGRGYKIYGQIEPRISFGMNNVKGFSERPNYLVFDDGTQIQMIYGKMIIHGLLFGQRQFNYEDKIYAFDKKHKIFSQITYGPRKKSMISKSSEPWDFCSGKIYCIKQQFIEIFNKSKPKAFPSKEYIVKQLSSFEGIWNGIISFDGVQYLDFKNCMPCKIEEEAKPLPSDSTYRKDLIKLIEGNIEQAQQEKEITEQIQRRDRKLRQKYQNNNSKQNAKKKGNR